MSNFKNKTVVVVGGARGIGEAVVRVFVNAEAKVWIADTNTLSNAINQYQQQQVAGFDTAKELSARLNECGASTDAVELDATSECQVRDALGHIESVDGKLDVVVNVFGTTQVKPLEDMSLDDFHGIIEGNLDGVFLMAKYAAEVMKKHNGGSIINFSSISGRQGFSKVSHYCAAKFGVIGFTSSIAKELAKYNIQVNAVCPGVVRTTMWEYLLEEFHRDGETKDECWERMCSMIPQGRSQTPEAIAEAVLMLASNSYMTGQAISVDGGMYDCP